MDDHNHIHFSMLFPSIIFTFCLFLLTINLPQSHSQPPPLPAPDYKSCKESSYNCGNLTGVSYPFWGQNRSPICGGGDMFNLTCHRDVNTTILIDSQNFTVLGIFPNNQTMTMKRTDLEIDICSPQQFNETNLIPDLLEYPASVSNITIFYNCSDSGKLEPENLFSCGEQYGFSHVYKGDEYMKDISESHKCTRYVKVPVGFSLAPYHEGGVIDRAALERGLYEGFEVKYDVNQKCINCLGKEGDCPWGTSDDVDSQSLSSCYYCSNGSNATHCSPASKKSEVNWKRKIILGVASAVVGALAIFLGVYVYKRRKNNSYAKSSYAISRSLSYDPSLEDPEQGSRYFGAHLFTYTELEEATNNFDPSKRLGNGSFGIVNFGILRDGRCVAVKRLYENNCRRVEQFMNEVEILIRVVHPNLVSLYGCTSRHSRELLLVYEYVSNGTVADHLHGKQANSGNLSWCVRMNIAVETASALKYLHASEIIHRDVKTNNILLDNHFRVKVADFGLSRFFPVDVTHVSTAPQGTPGYLDPEYHQCYQLTSKSDVYSFGVVLIELISSLPAVDIARDRCDINLANMAINKIQRQALHELVDPTLGFESDFKARTMINAVAELAFQCVQNSKDLRPSMDVVLDALQDIAANS